MPETTVTDAPNTETTADESQADESSQQPNPADEVKKLRAEAAKYRVAARENAAAAAELAALKESQKTEAQKLADRAEAAEKRAAEVELSQMRLRVALRHGIDEADIDRLRGSTEEELDADAKAFAERLKKTSRPAGSVDQGIRGEAPKKPAREEFAELFKQFNK